MQHERKSDRSGHWEGPPNRHNAGSRSEGIRVKRRVCPIEDGKDRVDSRLFSVFATQGVALPKLYPLYSIHTKISCVLQAQSSDVEQSQPISRKTTKISRLTTKDGDVWEASHKMPRFPFPISSAGYWQTSSRDPVEYFQHRNMFLFPASAETQARNLGTEYGSYNATSSTYQFPIRPYFNDFCNDQPVPREESRVRDLQYPEAFTLHALRVHYGQCAKCGREGHYISDPKCCLYDKKLEREKCPECARGGHLSKNCFRAEQIQQLNDAVPEPLTSKMTASKYVECDQRKGPPYINIRVGLKIEANSEPTFIANQAVIVDSAADRSMMTTVVAAQIFGPNFSLLIQPSTIRLKSASGHGMPVLGFIRCVLQIGKVDTEFPVQVTDDDHAQFLLGNDFLFNRVTYHAGKYISIIQPGSEISSKVPIYYYIPQRTDRSTERSHFQAREERLLAI